MHNDFIMIIVYEKKTINELQSGKNKIATCKQQRLPHTTVSKLFAVKYNILKKQNINKLAKFTLDSAQEDATYCLFFGLQKAHLSLKKRCPYCHL